MPIEALQTGDAGMETYVAGDDFRVLINSVGEYTRGVLGSVGLTNLRVVGDKHESSATICVTLRDDSWDNRVAALRRLADVRTTFLDELVLDFCFEDGPACGTRVSSGATVERVFA